jgi:hypothetical protein
MRRRSPAGWLRSGRGAKGGRRRIGLACRCRRSGRLADPTGPPDLVPTRPDPDPAAPGRVEEGLHGRRPGLPARRHRGPALPSPAAAQRHRPPHRGAGAAGRLLRRPTGGAPLGGAVGPLEHQDAGLPRPPARLADRRAAARLRPELHPVEGLWANVKDLELAHRPTTTLAEVADATEHGVQRICKSDSLVVGFLAHTGLSLDLSAVNPTHETQIPGLGCWLDGRVRPGAGEAMATWAAAGRLAGAATALPRSAAWSARPPPAARR